MKTTAVKLKTTILIALAAWSITGFAQVKTKHVTKDDGNWVLINGVKWATRNVGAPHTFVQNFEDYGGYYQWNKGTTDFLLNDDFYNSVYANSMFWLPGNDPSPVGYRVPTLAEIGSLTNTTYVKYEWTTQNGISGGRFTDRATGSSIFLPAAGYRYSNDGTLYGDDYRGYYWSSTQGDSRYACDLGFGSGGADWSYWNYKSDGRSVRPVAE
ncbi:MAG: fibrobacter succinogenes major paralogous domain-containing protein [Candidatus Azobacteroides sp.]|nr:fibrobacter succinogenes major paralogous domain-containing protein [Candidatus Azobacteroides sp.]